MNDELAHDFVHRVLQFRKAEDADVPEIRILLLDDCLDWDGFESNHLVSPLAARPSQRTISFSVISPRKRVPSITGNWENPWWYASANVLCGDVSCDAHELSWSL